MPGSLRLCKKKKAGVVTPFSFSDVTGSALNDYVISSPITPTGFVGSTTISITGGEYSINSGAWTSGAGTIASGASFRLRIVASLLANTTKSATVTVGTTSDTWSVTSTTIGAYATWNSGDMSTQIALSNGNLTIASTLAGYRGGRANIGKSTGKWYWECTKGGGTTLAQFWGASNPSFSMSAGAYLGSSGAGHTSISYNSGNGNVYNYTLQGNLGVNTGSGSVFGFALDADAQTLTIYTPSGSATYSLSAWTGGPYYPTVYFSQNSMPTTANFGQSAFAYTVPVGYAPGLF